MSELERGHCDGAGIRELPTLFDRQRFGLNVLIGVGYFVAQELMQFTWMILSLLQGHGVGWSPAGYYLATLATGVLEAAAFVFAVHWVRNARALPFVWGLATVVFGVAVRGALNALALEGWPQQQVFAPLRIASSFVYGALLMFGLVLAVRRWGARLWTLIVGAASGFLVHAVVFQIVWSTTMPDRSVDWEHPASAILDGVLLGGLIYAGLALHLKNAVAPLDRSSGRAAMGA